MIKAYILFCVSFAVIEVLTIHRQAIGIYRAYLTEAKIVPKEFINPYISGLIFFSAMLVLAPIIAIPYIANPRAAARGYAKALISTVE